MSGKVKKCCACKSVKPVSEFYAHKSHKDGLSSKCKDCSKAYGRKRYVKRGDEIRAQVREYAKNNRARKLAYNAIYYQRNAERLRAYRRGYVEQFRDRLIGEWRAYYHKNKDRGREKSRRYRELNKDRLRAYIVGWRETNSEKIARYRIAREMGVKCATPGWANQERIAELYRLARAKSKETGFEWHVDHIVPLRGETVCGLHVENNLQVIPATENRRKKNRFVLA